MKAYFHVRVCATVKRTSNFYAFFWVITRRLEFKCRRFGTLCLFHLHRQVNVSRIKLGIRNATGKDLARSSMRH